MIKLGTVMLMELIPFSQTIEKGTTWMSLKGTIFTMYLESIIAIQDVDESTS